MPSAYSLKVIPAAIIDETIVSTSVGEEGSLTAAELPEHSFFRGWKGDIEGGVNGSSGKGDNKSLRLGIACVRETDAIKTSTSLGYIYATSDGEKANSRGVLDVRSDWNLTGRWGFFAQGRADYGEFQESDWRLWAFFCPGYYLVRYERTKFLAAWGRAC